MNTYKCSNGDRISQKEIDIKIRKAKAEKIKNTLNEFGFISCEQCGISNGTYLDCSHNESVKSCKENGRTEKAFDVSNITILCRNCHQIKDGLNIQNGN